MSENWESEELEASVKFYADMRSKEMAGEKFTKASYYKSLSERFGRSPKAYEYRMQNISHIYQPYYSNLFLNFYFLFFLYRVFLNINF